MTLLAVALVFVAAAGFLWWADQQGFIALTPKACAGQDYDAPHATAEEVSEKYGISLFCARDYLGETWF